MLRQIDEELFDDVYTIMKDSFPFDEIRTFENQKKLLFHKNYKIMGLFDDSELLGFIAIWEFENFVFIEHFAIASNHRNKRLGSVILSEIEKINKKIILEVEHPTDPLSKKRIEFYRRNDFNLYDFNYVMPAFSKNHKPVPLCLMSRSNLTQADFEDFYDKIKNVINV